MTKKMEKTMKTSMQKISPGGPVTTRGVAPAPAHIAQETGPLGTEGMARYVRPPRVKVIQAMTSAELRDAFGLAGVISRPDNVQLIDVQRTKNGAPDLDATSPLIVVPIGFFVEWLLTSPMETKGTEPFIIERSLDPRSRLAQLSRSAETRKVPHPADPKLFRDVCECLNFYVVLPEVPPYDETPILITFAKGEHSAGTRFVNLIKLRKAAMYGCIFELRLAGPDPVQNRRKNAKGEWYGLEANNPGGEDPAWVNDEATYEKYKAMHLAFAQIVKEQKVDVYYDDDDLSPNDTAINSARPINSQVVSQFQ